MRSMILHTVSSTAFSAAYRSRSTFARLLGTSLSLCSSSINWRLWLGAFDEQLLIDDAHLVRADIRLNAAARDGRLLRLANCAHPEARITCTSQSDGDVLQLRRATALSLKSKLQAREQCIRCLARRVVRWR